MDGYFDFSGGGTESAALGSLAGFASDAPVEASAGAIEPGFARLLEREIPFLRRTVRRWRRDPADCDDLVQDTLVRALAGAHSFQPGSDLRGWLYIIMRNQAYASTASATKLSEALAAEPRDEACPPATHSRLELRDVDVALARLPAKQRLALMLIAVEGKSYEDGAKAMETTADAVRCHLARGRQRLRELVDSTTEYSPFLRASSRRSPALRPS